MTLERETYRDEERRTVEIYAATDRHMDGPTYQFDDAYRSTIQTVNNSSSASQQGSGSALIDEFEVGYVSGVPIYLTGKVMDIYESARKQHLAAYAMAFVSLFIGGVVLSSIALVFAFMARTKFFEVADDQFRDAAKTALRRAGTIAVAVCAVALALNIMSLIFIAPYVVSAMQSGDVSSLLPFIQQPTSTTTGGNPIFG